MAVRVKIKRTVLLKRLRAAHDNAQKIHKARLVKYDKELAIARRAVARELHKKADLLANGSAVALENSTIYGHNRNSRPLNGITIESKARLPRRPEEPQGTAEVRRVLALLEASEEETITVATSDVRFYGLSALDPSVKD